VELRKQLWNYVVGLNEQGVTVVLTTHYLEEAQELCDQIAIINKGSLVACEPTRQLLKRVDTRTVVITPTEPLTEAPQMEGFTTRLRDDGHLAVQFKTGASGVEQALAAVRAAGVQIKDLATEDPDLEDVFLSLTYNAAA
jgi:ABC-2 type transport system ATP-binding protein